MLFPVMGKKLTEVFENFVLRKVGEFPFFLNSLFPLFLANVAKMMLLKVVAVQLILIVIRKVMTEIAMRMAFIKVTTQIFKVVKFLLEKKDWFVLKTFITQFFIMT